MKRINYNEQTKDIVVKIYLCTKLSMMEISNITRVSITTLSRWVKEYKKG